MAIFRINKTSNYTVMSNYHLKDLNLSYKAKGLLSFMLSLPDNWDYSIEGLTKVSKESIKAIRSTLKELEDNNYLVRNRNQLDNGQFNYDYSIYEVPYSQKGHADIGHALKDTQINTNIINTNNKDKIDKQINPLVKELINKNYISENDLEIYQYNNLINELIDKYNYEQVVISINYILKQIKFNKYLDENGNSIINKFGYFKNALINNLEKLNSDISLDWNNYE